MELIALNNIPNYTHQNYYITNGYAYTNEHVIVNKVFVYKIPRKTTVGQVRGYLKKYGVIKDIRFMYCKDRYFPNVAFVYFESPAAAARVLHYYHKNPLGKLASYLVKVGHNWHQPYCQSTKQILNGYYIRNTKIEEDQFVPPNRDSIHVLNDDCLEIIIRLLPIPNQLRFARTCSRICQLFQMTSKSLYRTLYLERLDKMTPSELWDFFDFAGSYFIRIEGTLPRQNNQRIVKFMSMFCNNVKELVMDSSMYFRLGIFDYQTIFGKLKKLKILKLSDQFQISGKDLTFLPPTIESLSIHCLSAKNKYMISLCRSLRNLEELDFGDLFSFSNPVVDAMAVSCRNLKTLTLGVFHTNYKIIGKLPKLQTLCVHLSYYSRRLSLTQLARDEPYLPQLWRIKLFFLRECCLVKIIRPKTEPTV